MSSKEQSNSVLVGTAFCKRFYGVLTTAPSKLPLFYREGSVVVRSVSIDGLDGRQDIMAGLKDIKKMCSVYENSSLHVELYSMDFVPSVDESILCVVTGVLFTKVDQSEQYVVQSFTQTFLLTRMAEDENSFYIANDVMRLLDTMEMRERTTLPSPSVALSSQRSTSPTFSSPPCSDRPSSAAKGTPIIRRAATKTAAVPTDKRLLPDDVLVKIFSFLRSRDFLKMQLVCKRWTNIFKTRQDLWALLFGNRWDASDIPPNVISDWKKFYLEKHAEHVENRKITRIGQQIVSHFSIWHRGLFDLIVLDDIIEFGEKQQLLEGNNIILVINEILSNHNIDPISDINDGNYFSECDRKAARQHIFNKVLHERGVKPNCDRKKREALTTAFLDCFGESETRYFIKHEDEECILFEAGIIAVDQNRGVLLWQGF